MITLHCKKKTFLQLLLENSFFFLNVLRYRHCPSNARHTVVPLGQYSVPYFWLAYPTCAVAASHSTRLFLRPLIDLLCSKLFFHRLACTRVFIRADAITDIFAHTCCKLYSFYTTFVHVIDMFSMQLC